MYPNYPEAYDVKGSAGLLIKPDMAYPSYKKTEVNALSEGPAKLGLSNGVLVSRFWLAEFDGLNVTIKTHQDGEWLDPVVVFSPSNVISEFDLTFDQAGNPVVFYMSEYGELFLYYYSSTSGDYTELAIGVGSSPLCMIDNPSETGLSNTDVMIFYVKSDRVYTRLQRERYATEHYLGIEEVGVELIDAGVTYQGRTQVSYRYPASDYTPPPPQPPLPPEFTGDYVYMQASTTQFGLEKPLINSAQHDDISITFNIYGANKLLSTLNPTWGAYGIPIFCEGGTTTLYPIPLWYNKSVFFDILSPQYSYFRNSVRDAQLKASRKFSLAFMYIDNALHLTLVVNGKKYAPIMPFNLSDGRWTVAITGNVLTVLNDATTLFTMEIDRGQDGDSEPEPGRFGAYSLGPLHDMWRQNFRGALYGITVNIAGAETNYPLMTQNSLTQESYPPGNNITIYNHKPANWKYMLA